MTTRTVLLAALAAASATVAAWHPAPGDRQQPRDGAPTTTGTAAITGRVLIDGDPKQPARRTRVTITEASRAIPGRTTTTDDGGAFAFRELPPGRFTVQAFKDAYLRASYGASRPDRAGTPVVVTNGQVLDGLIIPIVRGSVITGTVRDARDRPLSGVTVRVLRLGFNGLTGERTLTTPASSGVNPTDDRGEYRAYGLPPGSYLVLVPGPSQSGRGNESIRQLTSGEVRQALLAARSGSVPTAAPTPPPPAIPGRLNAAPVFHPGVTDIGSASVVQLTLGEERAGVDVTTQLVSTATVTVTVASSSGELPAGLSVRLAPSGPNTELLAGAGIRGLTTQPQRAGRYVFSGVAPGAYTAKAILGRGRGAAPDGPIQWAAADVHVAGDDVAVDLVLQPGVPVNGRVVFEGAQPTATELEGLAIMLMAPAAGGELQTFGGGRVDKDGRFTFASLVPDTYRFATTWSAPSASGRWSIRTATANGREAYEAPLRVDPAEPVEWIITMTDQPPTLTGRFVDPAGRPAPDYHVVVFPTDRAQWIPGSRRVRTTRPATDGLFTIRGLPPGEYYLAAVPDLESGEWNDAAVLAALVNASARVTIRDGETTTQDYRLRGRD